MRSQDHGLLVCSQSGSVASFPELAAAGEISSTWSVASPALWPAFLNDSLLGARCSYEAHTAWKVTSQLDPPQGWKFER
jgi:hypothetical protein